MSVDAAYPWLKALHVAAAVTFVGGVLAVSILLAAVAIEAAPPLSLLKAARRWDRAVTTPAMLILWTLGLVLAVTQHWFVAGWLQLKLIFVLALSGLHGVQSGKLRRLAAGGDVKPMNASPVVVTCIVIIAILAVLKPF